MVQQTPDPAAKPPVGIIFDADLGNGVEDVLALALLYGVDGKNEARVVSVSVSKPNLKAAALCEVVGRFYAGAVTTAFAAVGRTLPVGLATTGPNPGDTDVLTVPLARKNADGSPLYAHGIKDLNDTAEVPALIRNAFTAQHDGNAIVVLTGPATDLAAVLEVRGAREWIERKVRLLAVQAGAFAGGSDDANVKADVKAAKKLFAEWPTPIVVAGVEIGEALRYPASSIESDFGWSQAHPVVDAYRAAQAMPYDAPLGAAAIALYAARPSENYFKLSEPGKISVSDDGRTAFTPASDGAHRYLVYDPAQRERVMKAFVDLISAKPVPRQPRFRPQQQQQDKDKDKPAAPKPPVEPPPQEQ